MACSHHHLSRRGLSATTLQTNSSQLTLSSSCSFNTQHLTVNILSPHGQRFCSSDKSSAVGLFHFHSVRSSLGSRCGGRQGTAAHTHGGTYENTPHHSCSLRLANPAPTTFRVNAAPTFPANGMASPRLTVRQSFPWVCVPPSLAVLPLHLTSRLLAPSMKMHQALRALKQPKELEALRAPNSSER